MLKKHIKTIVIIKYMCITVTTLSPPFLHCVDHLRPLYAMLSRGGHCACVCV